MNNELITVDGKELEYKGEKVLSSRMIADLHGKKIFHVNEVFNNNRDKFVEGVDVFIIFRNDLNTYNFLFTSPVQKEAYLFTRSGYLNLCKIFNDKKSWDVFKMVCKIFNWAVDEVMPQVRQTGSYSVNKQLTNAKILHEITGILVEHEGKLEDVTNSINNINSTLSNNGITASPTRLTISTRTKIVNLANIYADYYEMDHREVYNSKLYRGFRSIKHIDLPKRAKNAKYSNTLEYAEKFGHIHDLFEVAKQVLAI